MAYEKEILVYSTKVVVLLSGNDFQSTRGSLVHTGDKKE